jgi:hypothetical protein
MVMLEKKKEYCVEKEINSGDQIKASFMITGQHQETVTVAMKGPHSMDYYTNNNQGVLKSSDEINLNIEYQGVYSLCFLTKTGVDTVASFEYFTMNESGHLITLAKDDKLEEMYKNVTVISYMFEEIERNLKFYAERKEIHSKIITEVVDLIQKLAVYKIGIIVLLAFLQVFIIQKFFKRNDKQESRSKVSISGDNIYL